MISEAASSTTTTTTGTSAKKQEDDRSGVDWGRPVRRPQVSEGRVSKRSRCFSPLLLVCRLQQELMQLMVRGTPICVIGGERTDD